MKYLDEYRDDTVARKILDEIHRTVTKPWVIMEVCGGQTHSIVKYGLDYLLPGQIELVHGPGCPVCVTPLDMIDRAHAIGVRIPAGQHAIFGERGRDHAWNSIQPFQQSLAQRRVGAVSITGGHGVDVDDQQALRRESKVHIVQVRERSQEQTRAHQEYQRHRHLGDHQQ